jgi:hypothetical protein
VRLPRLYKCSTCNPPRDATERKCQAWLVVNAKTDQNPEHAR